MYGEKFRMFMDSLVEEFGPLPQETGDKEPPGGKKRAAECDLNSLAQKKLKTHSECSATDLMAFPLLSSRQTKVLVRICTGHVIYLQNNDKEAEAVIKQSTLICGFGRGDFQWGGEGSKAKGKGKGKLKKAKQDEQKDDDEGLGGKTDGENRAVKDIAYSLVDASTLVMHNGQLQSLKQTVHEKRQTDPTAAVAYAELVPSPTTEDSQFFTVKMTHDVRFVPAGGVKVAEEAAKKPNMQLGAASLVPLAAWDTGLTKLAWIVRWTVNGLMPARPQIVAAGSFVIPAGQAVQLA